MIPDGDTIGVLALFLGLGATPHEAQACLAKVYGNRLPDTVEELLAQALGTLAAVREAAPPTPRELPTTDPHGIDLVSVATLDPDTPIATCHQYDHQTGRADFVHTAGRCSLEVPRP